MTGTRLVTGGADALLPHLLAALDRAQRCEQQKAMQRRADFMAAVFRGAGIAAVAVHAGPASAPRATSLQQLQRGELRVLFAVDMFDEGVDVPLVDTVLMLRPTESTILWLQQLGRGLRVAAGKPHLTVIDYIGNHRSFLTRLAGLGGVLGREEPGRGVLRDLLISIVSDRIALPPGCAVTYALEARAILEALLAPARGATLLEAFVLDFRERHGRRPTALDVFHAGFSPRASAARSPSCSCGLGPPVQPSRVATWQAWPMGSKSCSACGRSRSTRPSRPHRGRIFCQASCGAGSATMPARLATVSRSGCAGAEKA